MKISNILVSVLVCSGILATGVSPAQANEKQADTSFSAQKQITNTRDQEQTINFDMISGQVTTSSNANFGDLGKTGPNPYITSQNFYIQGVTTRPVGIKTTVNVNNIVYGFSRRMEVQQYISKKKKWVTVASKTTQRGSNNGSSSMNTNITIPAFNTKSKGGTVSYRINFPKTKFATGYSSSSMKVKYINPRFYTGYKKSLYNDMKASNMCPNIIIETGNISRGVAGRAYLGQQYKIKASKGLKGKYRQRVSVHECAHIKGDLVYGGNTTKFYSDANRMFGIKNRSSSTGMEYLADCMSFAKMGKRYIPGYKKSCSKAQINKAKRIWSGKKLY